VADAITARVPRPDEFAPARRQLEEGDPFAFRATSEPLNREEREARSASASALTAGEVAAALADLARLFADAEPARPGTPSSSLRRSRPAAPKARALRLRYTPTIRAHEAHMLPEPRPEDAPAGAATVALTTQGQ